MKRIYTLLILSLISINSFAQNGSKNKPDVIQKINGEEMKGKVVNFTMKEICDVLGVEYVIDVAVQKKSIV